MVLKQLKIFINTSRPVKRKVKFTYKCSVIHRPLTEIEVNNVLNWNLYSIKFSLKTHHILEIKTDTAEW